MKLANSLPRDFTLRDFQEKAFSRNVFPDGFDLSEVTRAVTQLVSLKYLVCTSNTPSLRYSVSQKGSEALGCAHGAKSALLARARDPLEQEAGPTSAAGRKRAATETDSSEDDSSERGVKLPAPDRTTPQKRRAGGTEAAPPAARQLDALAQHEKLCARIRALSEEIADCDAQRAQLDKTLAEYTSLIEKVDDWMASVAEKRSEACRELERARQLFLQTNSGVVADIDARTRRDLKKTPGF